MALLSRCIQAFCTGPVLKVRASTYLRLRLLDRHTCQQQFGEFLNEQEIREMLHRRNYMLRWAWVWVGGGRAGIVSVLARRPAACCCCLRVLLHAQPLAELAIWPPCS